MTVPFRIGATSYVIPAGLAANAAWLSGRVEDMELVLFDVEGGPCNFPSPETVRELAQIAADGRLTYTVHLPLDIRLNPGGRSGHPSLTQARRAIESTLPLNPYAYVFHLDGRDLLTNPAPDWKGWVEESAQAIELLSAWAGGSARLALENLETYPLECLAPVLDRVAVGRCVDIGHLWLDSHDPLPYLQAALARTHVVHLHGLAERDHASLACMPSDRILPVLRLLIAEAFSGVLTLEVFGQADFESSLAALKENLKAVEFNSPASQTPL